MTNRETARHFALEEIRGTGFFKSIEWVNVIDSTSKSLVRCLKTDHLTTPALLIADQQSSGVGRGGNSWWSPDGCLMFSMAIPMSLHTDGMDAMSAELLPLRIGLSVASTLSEFSERRIKVKWPNDVYVDGRKIAGILIEVVTPNRGHSPPIAIVGIGINCQVDFLTAPSEIRNLAISLHECAPSSRLETCTPENVLVQFIHSWLEDSRRFAEDDEWMFGRWTDWSLLDGLWVEVKHPYGIARGVCLGINRKGALRIQNESLQITEVLSGTVLAFHALEDPR